MKSKITTSLWSHGGGFRANLRDWRVATFAVLALFAGTANLIQVIILGLYSELYTPIIWFILAGVAIVLGVHLFNVLFIGMMCVIVLTNAPYAYRSLSMFILMSLVLSKSRKERLISLTILCICYVTSSAIDHNRIFDIFSLIIQVVFAFFCYYGFLYTGSAAFGNKPKLLYTEKEYRVMYALATQDKTQKEVCYELGISGADMARTLTSAREKNGYTTNDMLLRQFAIELYKGKEK